jgi:hypothetical protein
MEHYTCAQKTDGVVLAFALGSVLGFPDLGPVSRLVVLAHRVPNEDVSLGHKSLFTHMRPRALESGLRVTYRMYLSIDWG